MSLETPVYIIYWKSTRANSKRAHAISAELQKSVITSHCYIEEMVNNSNIQSYNQLSFIRNITKRPNHLSLQFNNEILGGWKEVSPEGSLYGNHCIQLYLLLLNKLPGYGYYYYWLLLSLVSIHSQQTQQILF